MTTTWGPGEISSENARLVAYVMFSPSGLMFVVPVLFSLLMESKMRLGLNGDYWQGADEDGRAVQEFSHTETA